MKYPKTAFLLLKIALLPAIFCFSCKDEPPPRVPPPVAAPVILKPDFSITSITIMQAELVNTRLKVKLRIENPNSFPVTLSKFEYELYGEGRFWADGLEKNVFSVPASDFVERDLYLIMNFIDMKRDLFDKVVAMDLVEYRFNGTVEINAADLPVLTAQFDLEGQSEVAR